MSLGDQPAGLVLLELVEVAVADELDELVEAGQERRLAAADRDAFIGQRVAADLPAAVHLAEHHVVGDEHVVDEHGVEHRVAGELPKRLDLDPLGLHVEQEVGDALMLGRAGVGAGQQRTPLRELRAGGPDLLPGDAPTAVDLRGLGGEAGEIRARTRLGKQLTPDHLAAERRRQELLLLSFGAVGDDRRDDPRGDAHLRSLDPPGGELLGDDDLFDRGGGPSPRCGQVRLHPPTLGDGGVTFFSGNLFQRRDLGPDLLAQLERVGVQVDVDGSHAGRRRGVDDLLGVVGGAAERGGQHDGAPVVHVGVVLPGEADAAVDLDAVLGAVLGGDGGEGRGDGGGELEGAGLLTVVLTASAFLVDGAGGIPHRGGGAFGFGDHVGALVLDGLELADRATELFPDLGVGRGGVGGPPRNADALCREQRRDQRSGHRLRQVGQHAVVGHLDAVGAHVRDGAQRVDGGDRLDLELVGVEDHPLLARFDRDRQDQYRGLRGGGYGAGFAADHQAVTVPRRGQCGADRVGGDGLAGGQTAQHGGVGIVGRDQCAGDGRRHEGAGHGAVAELGGDDGQFQDAEALPADRLGEVDALQALFGRRLPVGRRVGDRVLEGFVQNLRGRDTCDV